MADNPFQLNWDFKALHGAWPTGPDNAYLLNRLRDIPVDATAEGARGPVLEVGASEAIHSSRLSLRGLKTVALDPSFPMLGHARERMAEYGTHFELVRGISEKLPFPDESFDRVLCESTIDHLADPAVGIREMARVLRPDGRLIIGVVNYGSINVRMSRLVYRVARRLRLAPRDVHLFWDSPVPIEHTFECTYPILMKLCGQYLELDRAFGVSIGWAFPGWGDLLGRLSGERATAILSALDRLAYRMPRVADYILSVWKPRTWGPSNPR
jgi:SAM-dependent methyltransferase